MKLTTKVTAALAVGFAFACAGADDPKVLDPANRLAQDGDVLGASTEYEKIKKENPDSVYALEGVAYDKMLRGDYEGADKELAAAETKAKAGGDTYKDEIGKIKVRRALVALKAGKLDDVKKFGADSNEPVGQVLAAEVHLADAETDEALKLLKSASSAPGVVGETAKTYVTMLESEDAHSNGLAEATALWALGQRDVAVEAAEELVRSLPEEHPQKNELQLMWAGRAVTAGRPAIAQGMLDAMSAPPPDQAWRVQATHGMIAIAEGRNDEGITIFATLAQAGAPADGLSDALATACGLTTDVEVATTLAGSVESVAAARCLASVGALDKAKEIVPKSSYKKVLEAN